MSKNQTWFEIAKSALKNNGITYREAAQVLGVTESAVGHYMNGRREPSIDQLKGIAKMAGISLSEMCGEDPRFVTNKQEKALIDAFRSARPDRQETILSMILAWTLNQDRQATNPSEK